jgi:DNA repair protein RAD50
VQAKLNDVKRDLKDIAIMKQQAGQVTRNQKELDRLKQEIATIETDLSTTGSTKTADDVQAELNTLSEQL